MEMSFGLAQVHLDPRRLSSARTDEMKAGGRDGLAEERRVSGRLTVLTVTRNGVVAPDVASMVVGVVLSDEFPGTLRRRPVRSGGDSASTA